MPSKADSGKKAKQKTTPDQLQLTDELQAPPQPPVSCKNPVIKYAKAFELRAVKGLSYEEAGKIIGVRKQTLRDYCIRHGIPAKPTLQAYQKNKAGILDSVGANLLESLTVEEIKERASPYQRVGMYGILYDKARLERGESTQNVAYQDIGENIAEIDKEIAELQGLVGSKGGEGIDAEIAALEGELGEDD